MPVDYQTIMETNLSTLGAAAKQWREMGRRFSSLQKDYRRHVKNTVGDAWSGESALSFSYQGQTTMEEYGQAAREAKAVGNLLDEAHRTLTQLKKKLTETVDDAKKAGMKVDSKGRCSVDESKIPDGEKKTKDDEEKAQQWSENIKNIVKRIQDEDADLKRALTAKDTSDKGLKHGFNGSLKGSTTEHEAGEAASLANKVADGDASKKEMNKFNSLVNENKGDRKFSQTLLQSVEPDDFIRATTELDNKAYYGDTDNRKQYLRTQDSLASVLATATKDKNIKSGEGKEFYKEWRSEMKKAGTDEYSLEMVNQRAGDEENAKGYQVLVTLMKRAETEYDESFLHDIADDVRNVEDPDKGGDKDIWNLTGEYAGEERESSHNDSRERFANDPLDGILGVMSNNPEAATNYFDPASEEGKDRFRYLKVDRDWNIEDSLGGLVDKHDIYNDGNPGLPRGSTEDVDSRAGFGAALEAAMTGQTPGTGPGEDGVSTRHSNAEVRVFEHVVKQYSDSEVHSNMRQNMANAVASYPEDIYKILSTNEDFSDPANKTQPHNVGVNREDHLIPFLRETAEDGAAFRTIHDSQMSMVSERIEGLEKSDFSGGAKLEAVGNESGSVIGALDKVRTDVLKTDRDDQIDSNNWAKNYAYHGFGGPVTLIPGAGDALQRLVHLGTEGAAEDMNTEVEEKTEKQLLTLFQERGYGRLDDMLSEQAQSVGIPNSERIDNESAYQLQLKQNAKDSYNSAMGITERAMGGE